jgi:hypothetical protein
VRCWLESQRSGGIERRDIKPENDVGVAEGACPGCGANPFLVQGHGIEAVGGGVYRAGGTAKCCGDSVGYLYAEEQTIFGAEEDRAVIEFGRARVYGGGLRP